MVGPGDAVAFYRQRLEADASEATGFAVVTGNVAKHDVARRLLIKLTQGGYAEVSRRACEMRGELSCFGAAQSRCRRQRASAH